MNPGFPVYGIPTIELDAIASQGNEVHCRAPYSTEHMTFLH